MAERKILILTNRIPYPMNDGGNLAMQVMIEGYHRAGWQVHLLSMNTTRHYIQPEVLKTLYTHLHAFEWVDVNNDIRPMDLVKNYLFSKEPEHASRFFVTTFKDKLKAVLKSFEPDAVQIESVYLSTYLPVIRKYSDAVTILRIHNVEYQIWQGLSKKHKSYLKKVYFNNLTRRIKNFERAAWTEYDLLLPITEKDAYTVSRLEDVKNIVVAPFSIDIDKVKQGSNERWVAYHMGAMDWIPNRDGVMWFLEKAWPKIHKVLPDFEFYFAGRKMPEDMGKLNLAGVHCMHEVPDAEAFIADKKILIVPLWSGGGVRVKILEAMAAGKIVITTDIGIKGIEAKAGKHYLQARKPEDFLKAIKWCLEHKAEAEEMAANARQLIKDKYEYRQVIAGVIGEVEHLLEG